MATHMHDQIASSRRQLVASSRHDNTRQAINPDEGHDASQSMLAHDDGEETKLQQPPMMQHNEIKLIANGEMSVRNRVQ